MRQLATKPGVGFTLVELMVTLTIVGVILSAGLISLRGYIPKQRLLTSVSLLEGLLQRAQSEATARSFWTCIEFSGTPITASLWVDKSGNHGAAAPATACGDSTDVPVSSVTLKKDITMPTGGTCPSTSTSSVIWFDTQGIPASCTSAACTSSNTWQIILSNPYLETQTRAREIEVLGGGLIQTVKLGDKGLDTSAYTKAPTLTSGCE